MNLVVVIPAHNEEAEIRSCLASLLSQDVALRILVSDNASTDATPQILHELAAQHGIETRRVDPMGPTEHFVSCGLWALSSGTEEYVAYLAADDRWKPGFAKTATSALDSDPQAGMVYPAFIWAGPDGRREIPPPKLSQGTGVMRQARALTLPDSRELANQLYGVFRRSAFQKIVDSWESGGEGLGVDYATVMHVLASERSIPIPGAVGIRSTRGGADLIERAGVVRPVGKGLLAQAVTYVELNLRTNLELGRAMSRVSGKPRWLTVPTTMLVRTPQWVAAIPQQVRKHSAAP